MKIKVSNKVNLLADFNIGLGFISFLVGFIPLNTFYSNDHFHINRFEFVGLANIQFSLR